MKSKGSTSTSPKANWKTIATRSNSTFVTTRSPALPRLSSIIEALTGIRRSKNQVREFLKKIGMRFRKVGAIPGGADPDVQADFKKNSWILG